MNKLLILNLFFFFAAFALKAQENNNVIAVGLNYEIGSTSISNNFTNAFLFSDYIDSTKKQHLYNELANTNRLGADIVQKAEFRYVFDTLFSCKNFGISAGVYNNFHLDMNFTDDLMKLFFSGNKAFEGKTADLSNASLNMMQYQVFRLGIIKQFKTDFASHSFGFSVGFVNGTDYTNIRFKNALLYTAPDAEYIDLTANYQACLSDTSSSGKYTSKGKGASINFNYSYQCIHNNVFYVDVSDLGYIKWNNQTINTKKDTSIHFEGVVIDDILNISGNIFGNGNTDSIKQNYIYSGTTSDLIVALPVKLEIGYQRILNAKSSVFVILKKRFHSNYTLQYSAGLKYTVSKNTAFTSNLNIGGYSAIHKGDLVNLGIEIQQQFAKRFKIILGTNSMNGFVFSNSVSTQGIYASLQMILK